MECSMTWLLYEYDPSHLHKIYGVALASATVFFSLGFFFVWKNDKEHTLDFSHVVEQVHEELQVHEEVQLEPAVANLAEHAEEPLL